MTTLLTPYLNAAASQVGRKLWRKQVLPKAGINYKGRRITFDDTYLTDLADAFTAGAYDQVAFQLADATNTHTVDPSRFRGEVKGLEVTPDGLDAIVELTAEGERLIRDNPRLGVSVRIREALERADGKKFARAIHHVLGTIDPRLTGLRPWQIVELSNTDDTDEVVDLTAHSYTNNEGATMQVDLSAEQIDALNTILANAGIPTIDLSTVTVDDDTATVTVEDGDTDTAASSSSAEEEDDAAEEDDAEEDDAEEGDNEDAADDTDLAALTDDELDALIADLSAEIDDDTVDLAYADQTTTRSADAIRAARAETELLARDLIAGGVPPALVDLARPILEAQPGTIDLASEDGAVDVHDIVTRMLEAARGTVDLSSETGHGVGGGTQDDALEAVAQNWSEFLTNN